MYRLYPSLAASSYRSSRKVNRLTRKSNKHQLHFWEVDELGSRNGDEPIMADDTTATTSAPEKMSQTNGKPRSTKKPAIKKVSAARAASKKPEKAKSQAKKKGVRLKRNFPQNSLEDALAVPQSIKDKNGGQSFDTTDVAKACNLSRKGTGFFYLAASSRDYGLTEGSRDSDTISLTELGRSIVYPESAEQQRDDKIKAFLNVPLFKEIFEHYGGGELPEKQFVSSILFKKSVDGLLHDEFCELYKKNRTYLGITDSSTVKQIVKDGTADSGTVVERQAGEYSHQAFVIMPFVEKGVEKRHDGFFKETLDSLIKPACNAADFGVQTAHSLGSDLIHHTIIKQLDEADIVIADLTDHNPNVLFELGVRIALDKPVMLIRAKGTPPIFDVDNMMRVCEYDGRLWKTTIKTDIENMTKHLKGAWENVGNVPSYMKILKTGQTGNSVVPVKA
jgi:hypothetical protein